MHRLKRWFASLCTGAQLARSTPPTVPPAHMPPAAGAAPHAPIPQPEGLTPDQVAHCALYWMTVVPPEACTAGAVLLRYYATGIGANIIAAKERQEAFARYLQALARYHEAQLEAHANATMPDPATESP